jgi:hypothetical protein
MASATPKRVILWAALTLVLMVSLWSLYHLMSYRNAGSIARNSLTESEAKMIADSLGLKFSDDISAIRMLVAIDDPDISLAVRIDARSYIEPSVLFITGWKPSIPAGIDTDTRNQIIFAVPDFLKGDWWEPAPSEAHSQLWRRQMAGVSYRMNANVRQSPLGFTAYIALDQAKLSDINPSLLSMLRKHGIDSSFPSQMETYGGQWKHP